MSQEQAELWAIVEVMGHAKYAGQVSEYTGLGVPLVRVQVPAIDDCPAFEKLLGASAIFRITPVSRETAIQAAKQFRVEPLSIVHLPSRDPSRLGWSEDDEDDDFGV